MQVLDRRGKAIELRQKLGEGGEGSVWASPVAGDLAIKTYSKPLPPGKLDKLLAMTNAADETLLAAAAWPTRVVYNTARSAVGFEMPKLTGQQPFHQLIGTKSRLKLFPNANWQMLLHAAGNLAAAFHGLHSKQIVVGDVNGNNVVVGDDARVFFIDCDSFQIRQAGRLFRCEVGVPEYQPPELQNVSFASVERLASHDLFGMAVMIFQLLFVGKHPFMGRLPNPGSASPTIGENIARGNYFYDEEARRQGLLPPPASASLGIVTPQIARLFQRAFRGAPADRPTAREWAVELASAERDVVGCRANIAHRHLSAIPCPWCAIEAQAKIVYFAAPILVSPTGDIDDSIWATFSNADVERLWKEIASVSPPDVRFERPPNSRAAPAPIGAGLRRKGLLFVSVLFILAVVAVLALPSPEMRLVEPADLALAAGIWLFGRPRGGAELEGRRQRLANARAVLAKTESELAALARNEEFEFRRGELAAIHDSLLTQRSAFESEVAGARRRGEEEAKRRYLDSQFIRDAKVRGIGRPLAARLATWNIETALDVDEGAHRVPGIGRTKALALLEWRAKLESQFRVDPRELENAVRDTKIKYVRQRTNGRTALMAGANALRLLKERIEARVPELATAAAEARKLLDQYEADMRVLPPFIYR
jgi:DNA-binding helix-hairpin-helix protein with protein kinase domain